MDLIKVKEKIEQEKNELKIIINTPNKELEFFDYIISNNTLTSIQGLIELDNANVMTATLLCFNNSISQEVVYDYVKSNELLMEPELIEETSLIFEYLENHKSKESGIIGKKIDKLIQKRIEKKYSDNINLDKLIKLYEIYEKDLMKVLGLFTGITDFKKRYYEEQISLEEFKQTELPGIRLSNKRKTEISKDILSEEFNFELMFKKLSIIEKHYEELKNEDNKRKKTARKSIAKYTNLIPILNSLNDKKIIDKNTIINIIDMIDNEEILTYFLIELSKEHENLFNELNDKYKKLSNDNKKIIQTIFNKYNLDFNKLSNNLKNKILNEEVYNVEEILKSIKELGFITSELIYYILEYSTKEIIINYINLIKDGIFTKEFIINNKDVLSTNKETKNNYEEILEKLRLFQKEKINSRIFINDQNVYLVDFKQLEYNINILKQYNLLFNINKLTTFDLLKNNELETKIDIYLELGYEKILENNLILLNYDVKTIKKLYILKNLGILPIDINNLINILNNNNFLEYIDNIDNYIFNIVNYRIDTNIIKEHGVTLEKYFLESNNTRTIEINGVILSKNRIKRNLLRLEKANLPDQEKEIYSLIYGSILTEEEYNNIISNSKEIVKNLN